MCIQKWRFLAATSSLVQLEDSHSGSQHDSGSARSDMLGIDQGCKLQLGQPNGGECISRIETPEMVNACQSMSRHVKSAN